MTLFLKHNFEKVCPNLNFMMAESVNPEIRKNTVCVEYPTFFVKIYVVFKLFTKMSLPTSFFF